jgi:hypothetical protein
MHLDIDACTCALTRYISVFSVLPVGVSRLGANHGDLERAALALSGIIGAMQQWMKAHGLLSSRLALGECQKGSSPHDVGKKPKRAMGAETRYETNGPNWSPCEM